MPSFAHRRDGKAKPENGGTAERLGVHPVLLQGPGSFLRFGPGSRLPGQADARGTKLFDHLDTGREEIGVTSWDDCRGVEAGTGLCAAVCETCKRNAIHSAPMSKEIETMDDRGMDMP